MTIKRCLFDQTLENFLLQHHPVKDYRKVAQMLATYPTMAYCVKKTLTQKEGNLMTCTLVASSLIVQVPATPGMGSPKAIEFVHSIPKFKGSFYIVRAPMRSTPPPANGGQIYFTELFETTQVALSVQKVKDWMKAERYYQQKKRRMHYEVSVAEYDFIEKTDMVLKDKAAAVPPSAIPSVLLGQAAQYSGQSFQRPTAVTLIPGDR